MKGPGELSLWRQRNKFPCIFRFLVERIVAKNMFRGCLASPKRNIAMTFLLLSCAAATGCPHNAPSCLYLYCTHIPQPCLKWDTKKESRTCPESVTPN